MRFLKERRAKTNFIYGAGLHVVMFHVHVDFALQVDDEVKLLQGKQSRFGVVVPKQPFFTSHVEVSFLYNTQPPATIQVVPVQLQPRTVLQSVSMVRRLQFAAVGLSMQTTVVLFHIQVSSLAQDV